MSALYELESVERRYDRGGTAVHALAGVSLLQMLGAMDTPTAGRIAFDGQDLSRASDQQLTGLRRGSIGFVFQQFNLIPTLTAAENVDIAMSGVPRHERAGRVTELLESVRLADRGDHLPSRLSGGEQQRVAIARSLANNPRVVLADEPTGNLDSTTAAEVIEVLVRLWEDQGVTVVLVTHDDEVAARARRRIKLRSGEVISDSGG